MKKLLALTVAFAFLAGSAGADDEKGKGQGPDKGKGKKPDLAELFKKLDENGDGKLSQEEFAKAPMVEKIKEKRPGAEAQLFKRLDADKDGSLSADEFKKVGEARRKKDK